MSGDDQWIHEYAYVKRDVFQQLAATFHAPDMLNARTAAEAAAADKAAERANVGNAKTSECVACERYFLLSNVMRALLATYRNSTSLR